ncbi:hypothetical protein CHH59_21485 [Shouchella clausii]|uniref:Uncharacterized protein n=1 Tax=Shouchella clausii TaxID=79880 RepID=A0A268NTD6_SHOCL|nr:hypothetical protein [Shouchella clausii]PAE86658.1 hypothetical protein CHH72_22365 [Shouchella clausii]PAF11844.1 hypothetical protein CHH59_21485 [Shouchella clausii]
MTLKKKQLKNKLDAISSANVQCIDALEFVLGDLPISVRKDFIQALRDTQEHLKNMDSLFKLMTKSL